MTRRHRASRQDAPENSGGSTLTRPRPRRRRWLAVLVLVACAFIAAGFPVYVAPQIEIENLSPYRRADAIFVLGGAIYERYPYALELALEGFAPEVVVSNPNGAKDVWLTDLCDHPRYEFPVTCFEPDPPTTRGEAMELRRLAEQRGWDSVIVVTFVPHVSRARFILDRCFDGELIMAASPADIALSYWAWAYAYQTAGYMRAFSHTGC
ncbi:YdcF family protein [Rhodococcus rhodochrous]|nr:MULTISPECIES: YdcF family protein [Rhodococcus]MCD2098998.1 YdcF family protein [Rhodococcus rhodochrous]MCD2123416.1 YdcF family protein [Rhodococcus rhodochrous]MCQ4135169.1 YdcF family protein [Rhodococcus rhodochrous]MDJ0020096.1 YdcF family protein [Rhodococcus rhodochrous]MDJ0400929.1 YdcF family protein [Rhodococcus rhodochrous]